MCGCPCHQDPKASCHCDCNQTEQNEVAPLTRLVVYTYVHNHDCPLQGEKFVYRPSTVGMVMLLARPACAYTGDELAFVSKERV